MYVLFNINLADFASYYTLSKDNVSALAKCNRPTRLEQQSVALT